MTEFEEVLDCSSTRLRNVLLRSGVTCLSEICARTEVDWFRQKECGEVTLAELDWLLLQRGLSLTKSSGRERTSIVEDKVAEVRERTSIVEIVSRYTALKRTGRNHQGLCPFHLEKTPSFSVSEERGLFHCFGCQASGDVFKFLMLKENLTFPEAHEYVARKYEGHV